MRTLGDRLQLAERILSWPEILPDDQEFLAGLVMSPFPAQQWARIQARCTAISVAALETYGWKTEAAVRAAMLNSGLKRSRVYAIRREYRESIKPFRKRLAETLLKALTGYLSGPCGSHQQDEVRRSIMKVVSDEMLASPVK